jgi:Zn-dependent membrane protease YugP
MFFLDPLFLVFALPALLFGLWAQWRVKSAINKYSQVGTGSGLTGAQIARRILDYNGLHNVQVESVEGFLSDHYDPRGKVLRLSPEVYNGRDLAAAGVAAHEAGHALQDQHGYLPFKLRSTMVPTVQIGSWLGPILFMAGLFTVPFFGTSLAWLGVGLFALTTAFALVTLPVEFDASRRAKELLASHGMVFQNEMNGVSAVLNAAALTYVAALAQAVSTLLYYAFVLTGLQQQEE